MTEDLKEHEARALMKRNERRGELAELTFNPNGQMFQPKNGRELMDMANLMSTAGLMVKDIYREKPGACMGLIAVCAPYGMNPLQVSWKTYQTKTDGPISYESQVIVAMVNASGAVKGTLKYRYEGEGQNRRCICYGTLKGDTEAVEVWSPPLGQISPKNSPLWKTDPDQQLAYYTGRAWARRYKPEMLLGIYDVDEMAPTEIGPDHARDITPEPRQAPRRGGVMYRDPEPVDEIHEAEAAEETQEPTETPHDEDGVVTDGETTQGELLDAEAPAAGEDTDRHQRIATLIRRELENAKAGEDVWNVLDMYRPQLAEMKDALPAEWEAIQNAATEKAA